MSNETSIGVIVARFQVAELTEGHKEILEYVLAKKHNQNVIFLGIAPTRATKNNPLDYDSRRRMIEEEYPGKFTIMYQRDDPSDEYWSASLDRKIADIAGSRDVVLYGSRDSFGDHYFGKYPFEEYHQKIYCSGTEQRALAGKQVQSTRDWRLGCLYATQNRFPTAYPTVDCAIFDQGRTHIFMARKAHMDKLMFVGGFVDPKDESMEAAAKREIMEETGLEVRTIGYIGSHKIDDWRYRAEEDKIITSFFAFEHTFGTARAQDDIVEIQRRKIEELSEGIIAPAHQPLYRMLMEWLAKNK